MSNLKKVLGLLKSVSYLLLPRSWGPFSQASEETRFDHGFTISWSQCAEDLVVAQALEDIGLGRYLDIGAHHPSRFSVTRKLYERGWSGIDVDANAKLLGPFQKARPRDITLNVAVGFKPSYELTIFDETAISTVDSAWKERFISEKNTVGKTVLVPGRTLRSILDEYFPESGPNFLNIDIEGADLEALMSGDLGSLSEKRRPQAILVENPNPKDPTDAGEIGKCLEKLNYRRIYILPFSSLYKR